MLINILLIILLLILTCLALYWTIKNTSKTKWTCKENECEKDIDGEFSSKQECKNSCKQDSDEPANAIG